MRQENYRFRQWFLPEKIAPRLDFRKFLIFLHWTPPIKSMFFAQIWEYPSRILITLLYSLELSIGILNRE